MYIISFYFYVFQFQYVSKDFIIFMKLHVYQQFYVFVSEKLWVLASRAQPPTRGPVTDALISKAPRGNERGAMGSKNPPADWNPCFLCSAWFLEPWFRSKTPFPLCHCLVGRCLTDRWDGYRVVARLGAPRRATGTRGDARPAISRSARSGRSVAN